MKVSSQLIRLIAEDLYKSNNTPIQTLDGAIKLIEVLRESCLVDWLIENYSPITIASSFEFYSEEELDEYADNYTSIIELEEDLYVCM